MDQRPDPFDLDAAPPVGRLRRPLTWIAVIAACSIVGTAAELTILGHYDEPTQLLPYAALAALAWALRAGLRGRSARTRLAVRALGAAALLVAALGAVLHYEANLELAREIDPAVHGWKYVWSGIDGKIPFLAPLVLGQIGLLVIATTFLRPDR